MRSFNNMDNDDFEILACKGDATVWGVWYYYLEKLNLDIENHIPPEIIEHLNSSCVISGPALYDIILSQIGKQYDIKTDINLRLGSMGPYLESLKTLLNSVKGKLVDTHADIYNLLWNSDNAITFDLYTNDLNAIQTILEDDEYKVTNRYNRRIRTLTKTTNGSTINFNVFESDGEGEKFLVAFDETELSCFKLGYDRSYLYFVTRDTEDEYSSLQDLIHKRIYYDNNLLISTRDNDEYKGLNTFKMFMKAAIIDGFTFMSDDECAKELYSRFISTNFHIIHNAMNLTCDVKTDLSIRLIREEFFKVFNVQKLLKFTKENENSGDYDIPIAAAGSMYYTQCSRILRQTYGMGFTTLDGVPFIPEHTCLAIHYTTRISDILPYVDTMRPFNQLGKNYSYLTWSSIIVRITSLLYSNYEENNNISTINDIIDYIDLIDSNTKRLIVHNIRTNLCVDIKTITPAEMLTFYFIVKVVGYFDNIRDCGYTRLTTGVRFNYVNILTEFPSEEPHRSFDKFTDKSYTDENNVRFQQIIRTLENTKNCSTLAGSFRAPIPSEGKPIRLIINYFSFNFDMYFHLKYIYDFLIKTFDHDINIVLCNVIGDPFWVSMDVVDAPSAPSYATLVPRNNRRHRRMF